MKFLEKDKSMYITFAILVIIDLILTILTAKTQGLEGELNPLVKFLFNHFSYYGFIR